VDTYFLTWLALGNCWFNYKFEILCYDIDNRIGTSLFEAIWFVYYHKFITPLWDLCFLCRCNNNIKEMYNFFDTENVHKSERIQFKNILENALNSSDSHREHPHVKWTRPNVVSVKNANFQLKSWNKIPFSDTHKPTCRDSNSILLKMQNLFCNSL
jgi:hypothetical protein